MMHSKKLKIISMIIIIFMIIMVSGCNTNYRKETVVMATQIYHAIPNIQGDKRALQCEYIETDDYGRVLFAFGNSYQNGICVQQKFDDKNVYYYDNVSFLIGLDKYKDFSAEDLSSLKEANDWNKSLDMNKMISKELIKPTLNRNRETMIDAKIIEKVTIFPADKNENIRTSNRFFDYSKTGQELFYVERLYDNWELYEEYLMILNADGTYDPDNYLMKIDDWDQINELLAEIKENNGWEG